MSQRSTEDQLKNRASRLPREPGVYLFKDTKGQIIYVGKAVSLRNRVRSYFRAQVDSGKTRRLVSNIADYQLDPDTNAATLDSITSVELSIGDVDVVYAGAGDDIVVGGQARINKRMFVKEGLAIFSGIDKSLPIIVAESVWQYSHHVLVGLIDHQAPILTLANWSGTWPGLVALLNTGACLETVRVNKLKEWLPFGEE